MSDVAQMMEELDDHGFTDTSPERKVAMLNDALYDAASREHWPHLETSITLTFDGLVDAPTNFPANFREAMVLIDTASGNKLEWVRLDVIEGAGYDLTQTGPPEQYYFIGDELHVWPVPPASSTVRMRYRRIPTAMEDDTLSAAVDWPVQHHRVLVLGALQRLYDMEDDPELAVRYEGKYEQRLATTAQEAFSRQTDRTDRIYVDPWFDGDDF